MRLERGIDVRKVIDVGMMILLLLLIRFMSHIPVPGVKHSMFKLAVAGKGNGYFQLYDRLTGEVFQI